MGSARVHAAGITGSGVTIAVPAASDFDLADVALFRRNGTLPAGAIVKHFVGAQTITGGDALTEALIDVEWAGALAPEATIVAVIGAGDLTNAINGALTEAITKNLAPIVSVSYGVCELFGSPVAPFYDTLFKQAAAQGQSVLVASGDTGVTGCAPDNLARSVDVLAASPWVTGVGGTQLDPLFDADGNATGWGGEVVWNDSGASGGGVSTIFQRPAWQAGPGVPPGVMRVVPDVAFPASSRSPGFVIAIGGRGTTVGGTSVGTPVWASLVALLVQQKGRLGLLNPELYRLGALQAGGGPAVFHDVVQGTNGFGAVSGFVAGPGYDAATGWGSFDAPGAARRVHGVVRRRPCLRRRQPMHHRPLHARRLPLRGRGRRHQLHRRELPHTAVQRRDVRHHRRPGHLRRRRPVHRGHVQRRVHRFAASVATPPSPACSRSCPAAPAKPSPRASASACARPARSWRARSRRRTAGARSCCDRPASGSRRPTARLGGADGSRGGAAPRSSTGSSEASARVARLRTLP